ncbi:MAG: Bug family tripartite tricarboxylate transporter substrate binding protein [Bacteroidota bacterium]|jgi:tripartite-type tricarboxylate transporter receptor subunit TctC|nr:tripartite tricarboxylate transporter substrate binding protein [Burkholderiales bacterium]
MNRASRTIAAASLALAAATVAAQDYPAKPITLVVPFAAGSGTDGVARIVGQKLGERLKQQVLVENKAGASAQIGAEYVAKAKPDGYTLFMATNTPFSANPSLFKALRYDPIKDFTPIVRVGELPFALAVSPKLPVNTTRELLDFAKANPGKISYATPNSTSLVASETIKRQANVDIVGVQYKSSPQALTDLVGGQLEMYVVDLGSGLSTLKGGKVKTLAVTPARGTKILPGVPPIAQALPGFDLTSWNGIFAPAGLPRPIVDKLNAEVLAVLAEKDVQEKLANIGFEVWPSKSPDEFVKYVGDQLALWTRLIKEAGIKPE